MAHIEGQTCAAGLAGQCDPARRAAVAGVVKLVDALDSKSSSERSVGSSPTTRTKTGRRRAGASAPGPADHPDRAAASPP